jgi:sugar phosphate isomerase/epimerase
MNQETNRRNFLKSLGMITLGTTAGASLLSACDTKQKTETASSDSTKMEKIAAPWTFTISLAEWSLNKALFANKFTNLDFPAKAKNEFGISAVEYVNQFFKEKAKDQQYLAELKKRCDDNGVTSVLIMVDDEGDFGDLNAGKRKTAVENHLKWVDAAKFLGCHSIRVNARGEGTADEVGKAATEGLRALSEYAQKADLNIIVENHGGYSSNGQWLANVIKNTQMANCGTLPDFGNFCIKTNNDVCEEWYDRYQGVKEMMPYAKGVSAKTNDFDTNGNCIETDYEKMLQIVKDAGYNKYIGIEFEGSSISEEAGIRATKALLERVGQKLSV